MSLKSRGIYGHDENVTIKIKLNLGKENLSETVIGAFKSGADDVFIKPYRPALLVERIEALMSKKSGFSDK